MKLLFVAFLATWTVRILSCRTFVQNGRLIRQFVERHAEKTVEESLKFKYQEMERLKTEIEELEEQKTDEDLQDNREDLDEDISSDYFDKFLENGEEEQDDEEATVTDVMEEDKECNGPEYDDFYEEFCPSEHRFKRDATEDFLGGIWKTGEKFLDGNIGGSITTFLKTLAQPVFHYLIHSNNDPVMEKFTTRFIPETSLQGSSNALRMQGAAEEGDGARVWETMHQNSEAWNPRSSWNHLKDRSQAEKLAFKKYIPTILAVDKTISKRLKDISLVITTLSTSLHDTMVEGMNKGFKTASESLRDLNDDHRDLLKVLSAIFDVIENDIPAEMKIVAVSIILAFIILQSGIGFWQNRTIQLQNGSMETVIREMSQKMEHMEQVLEEAAAKEAKLEKKLDELIQERNNVAVTITRVVDQAVKGAINEAKFQPARRPQVQDSQMRGREPFTNQTQPALNYFGNSVSNVSPNAVALVTQ